MYKYRKKPIVIEAFQMTEERRLSNVHWPEWLNRAWNLPHKAEGAVFPSEFPDSDGTDMLMVHTKEGDMLVGWGDYIIKGVQGELYPCKADIFAATYDAVEE